MSTDFTLAGYRSLMDAFLERGYQAQRFAVADPDNKSLVLRHDLDMSMQAALPIAEIENDMGLTATYFVMVRSEMYNPLSPRCLSALETLTKLDHEIGIHLDASLYTDIDALDEAAERECAALEAVTGRPMAILSFHRPAKELQGLERCIAGRRHTYQPHFFNDMGYCSDSRGGWYRGHPLDHPALVEGRALQLLTHPIWWHAAPGDSVREKLDRFVLGRFDLLRAELARNCDSYTQEFRALDPEPP